MSKRILVVDDDRSTATFVSSSLEKAGYAVDISFNGKEALIKLNKVVYDLIISDVEMPEMDGVDLYMEIKKNDALKNLPIVIITNEYIFKNAFSKLGVEGFVSKPISIAEILEVISSILGDADEQMRALVVSADEALLKRMELLFNKHYCKTISTSDSRDIIGIALRSRPNFVVFNVLGGEIPADQIIKALRVFSKLRDTYTVGYSSFGPEQVGDTTNVELLKESLEKCEAAGMTHYMGNFSEPTVVELLDKFRFK